MAVSSSLLILFVNLHPELRSKTTLNLVNLYMTLVLNLSSMVARTACIDVNDNPGHDIKTNDAAMAKYQLFSILQPQPHGLIHSKGQYTL